MVGLSVDQLEAHVERPVDLDSPRVTRDQGDTLGHRHRPDERVVHRAAGDPEAGEPVEQPGRVARAKESRCGEVRAKNLFDDTG